MIEEFLEDDHRFLGGLLHELEESLGRGDPRRTYELLDIFWARLATHIRAENLCLFPAILNAGGELLDKRGLPPIDDVRAAIAGLRADHSFFMDELARAVRIMRDLLAQPEREDAPVLIEAVRQSVAAVKQRLDQHNKLEEEQIYGWPSDLLSPSELAALDAAVRYQVQSLPPRFIRDVAEKPS